MTKLGTLLQAACTASGMPPDWVARLAGIGPERLRGVPEGHAELSAAELDRCARVFGVRLDDLLDGQAGTAPLTLLMRSSLEGRPAGAQEILTTEIHNALGEFLRVVRDIADLERRLGAAPHPLPRIPLLPARRGEHPGERAARTVRRHLKLDLDPIPSVRAIVERELSIQVVWVTEDQVDRSLDGACTIDPRPAVLVNLLEPQRYPWRTRITLAHELCHLLFDEEARGHRALVSPHGELRLFPGFAEIEVRARAFAACFLAPADGVQHVVGGEDPTSEAAIRRVGERFGVGRTVAINRLQHAFKLRDDARIRMETRAGEPYDADFAGDRIDEPLGFRRGALCGLVHDALVQEKVSGVRARRMLGLTTAEPLPFADLDEALRAPLVSRAEVMRRRGDQLLAQGWPDEGLQAAEARRHGAAWRVEVVGGGIGACEPVPRGYLVLSAAGDLAESHVAPV